MTKPMISFGPVKSTRLYEEICDQIRTQLVHGKICPGDKLPAERDLATQFGVSRAAVREALRVLEVSGLIELRMGAKGGAFILEESAPLTQSFENMLELGRVPLSDFTEARILITEAVVQLVCERATEEDFSRLDQNVNQFATALERNEVGRDTKFITEFYDLLAAATGNQMLRYITHSIAQLLTQVITATHATSPYNIAEQRREVVAALRARDATQASALLAKHFISVHGRMAAAFDDDDIT